ncbi:MAG: hypothetical protein WCK57_11515 [Verrucomicrobiae bacterium]
MNALTFPPHEAWLVVNGYKDIYNSSIPTVWRGRVEIHANPRPVKSTEYEQFLSICSKLHIKKYPKRKDFQTGGIVGSVEIADCIEDSDSFWFSGPYGYVLKFAQKTQFKSTKGKHVCFDAGDVDEYMKQSRARTSTSRNTPPYKIKQSVREAESRILTDMTLAREFKLMVAREKRLPQHKRIRERMLYSLQCTARDKRDLRRSPIDKAIADALNENDVMFFIKLGRVLAEEPFTDSYKGRQPSNLERLLVLYWAEARDGVPALHTLNRQSLRDVCAHVLKNSNLSADAVLKTRQRMGLATTRGRKKSVVINAKSITVV